MAQSILSVHLLLPQLLACSSSTVRRRSLISLRELRVMMACSRNGNREGIPWQGQRAAAMALPASGQKGPVCSCIERPFVVAVTVTFTKDRQARVCCGAGVVRKEAKNAKGAPCGIYH